ncbi:hypothetical protein [Paenarthrobacter sp. JL.01a]|uniref:hypothetical protein n=1 Tax=Paenarthrobacter sp. JL.01a TaxID=2979324 RepID=UPI0021C80A43|nr:hypothetical protein [Paenarthrobacter sp. JL.01a]UXM93321.1 hypothetical protein N5P29_08445 [Paenarthrobacter sp. JL.01a]
MPFPVETVQVELVNSWWEQILPVAALLISVFSVGLTLAFRYFDRLVLKVQAVWIPVETSSMQMFTGQDVVLVEVTNRSRTATTEVSFLLLQTNEKRTFGAGIRPNPNDSKLPAIIGPGQTASISYSAQRMGQLLNTSPEVSWIRAMAVSGHKTIRGKKHRDIVGRLRQYANDNP